MQKSIGSRIVICTIFGIVYYAADQVLTGVEATIDATATSNLLVARKVIDHVGLSGSIINTGQSLAQVISGDAISLKKNLSGTDSGNLKNY